MDNRLITKNIPHNTVRLEVMPICEFQAYACGFCEENVQINNALNAGVQNGVTKFFPWIAILDNEERIEFDGRY